MFYDNISTVFLTNFNPFRINALIQYPMKMLKNLWFSDVFTEYRNEELANQHINLVFFVSIFDHVKIENQNATGLYFYTPWKH